MQNGRKPFSELGEHRKRWVGRSWGKSRDRHQLEENLVTDLDDTSEKLRMCTLFWLATFVVSTSQQHSALYTAGRARRYACQMPQTLACSMDDNTSECNLYLFTQRIWCNRSRQRVHSMLFFLCRIETAQAALHFPVRTLHVYIFNRVEQNIEQQENGACFVGTVSPTTHWDELLWEQWSFRWFQWFYSNKVSHNLQMR